MKHHVTRFHHPMARARFPATITLCETLKP